MALLKFQDWPNVNRNKLTIYKRVHGCYVIVTPSSRAYLFDGGYQGDGDLMRRFVRGYIGVSRLTGAIISHCHQDHIGGIADMIELTQGNMGPIYSSGVQFLPEGLGGIAAVEQQARLNSAVERFDVRHHYVSHGDTIDDPDITITVVSPTEAQLPAELPGHIPGTNGPPAVSVIFEWMGTRVWLTGDQSATHLSQLPMVNMSADVFQIPHHGDPNYFSDSFLTNVVRPRLCLLGSRPYTETTTERLDDLDIPWVSLVDGPFEVRIDADGSIDVQQNHFPARFRYAGWMHEPVFQV